MLQLSVNSTVLDKHQLTTESVHYESMTFYSTGPRTKVRIAEINKQPSLSGYNMIQNEGDKRLIKC